MTRYEEPDYTGLGVVLGLLLAVTIMGCMYLYFMNQAKHIEAGEVWVPAQTIDGHWSKEGK